MMDLAYKFALMQLGNVFDALFKLQAENEQLKAENATLKAALERETKITE